MMRALSLLVFVIFLYSSQFFAIHGRVLQPEENGVERERVDKLVDDGMKKQAQEENLPPNETNHIEEVKQNEEEEEERRKSPEELAKEACTGKEGQLIQDPSDSCSSSYYLCRPDGPLLRSCDQENMDEKLCKVLPDSDVKQQSCNLLNRVFNDFVGQCVHRDVHRGCAEDSLHTCVDSGNFHNPREPCSTFYVSCVHGTAHKMTCATPMTKFSQRHDQCMFPSEMPECGGVDPVEKKERQEKERREKERREKEKEQLENENSQPSNQGESGEGEKEQPVPPQKESTEEQNGKEEPVPPEKVESGLEGEKEKEQLVPPQVEEGSEGKGSVVLEKSSKEESLPQPQPQPQPQPKPQVGSEMRDALQEQKVEVAPLIKKETVVTESNKSNNEKGVPVVGEAKNHQRAEGQNQQKEEFILLRPSDLRRRRSHS